MILKALTATTDASEKELIQTLYISAEQIRKNLIQLEKEGFIKRTGKRFSIM
ncbi:MAG: DeoR family transcriptional regulator [Nitrospira sp.]|nr:DeoR family transcriptional regulator [Nitrospira sp.]